MENSNDYITLAYKIKVISGIDTQSAMKNITMGKIAIQKGEIFILSMI
jgi:hypothetical protein